MSPVKIIHVITCLSTGGAEMMLYKLLVSIDRTRFDPTVVSMLDGGDIAPRIEALGIPVRMLHMRRGVPDIRAFAEMRRIVATVRPRMMQTWLLHADLMGGIAGAIAGVPVIWNIRHSVLDPAAMPRMTRITERSCAVLSTFVPRTVICCSGASRQRAATLGYDPRKLLVIPNGFDLSAFRPDPSARRSVRGELRISADAPLVGLVARYDPNKDHNTFLAAAQRVHEVRPDVHFLLCGREVDPTNAVLARQVSASGLKAVVHLVGERRDVSRIQAALDLGCSSSVGEGFPNAIGEAMACGVPCVVTDVGDSAEIVGETGRVVRPRAPMELAEAVLALLSMKREERRRLGAMATARIETRYELRAIARRYEDLYQAVIDERAA